MKTWLIKLLTKAIFGYLFEVIEKSETQIDDALLPALQQLKTQLEEL